MDTSRNAANSAVLRILNRAETNGLHTDDIIKMLGFEEKRQILPRLYALKNDGLIERLDGQIWRIIATENKNVVENSHLQTGSKPERTPHNYQTGHSYNEVVENSHLQTGSKPERTPQNYQTGHSYNEVVENSCLQNGSKPERTPQNYQTGNSYNEETSQFPVDNQRERAPQTPTEDYPRKGKISPAEPTSSFISYKNLLQEHCQKKHLPVPSYRTERGPVFGYIGFVTFNSKEIKSTVPMSTSKEAEQRVAFDALLSEQALPESAQFNIPSSLRNPAKKQRLAKVHQSVPAHTDIGTVFDQTKSYKSMLNEFAQKSKIPQPTYRFISHSEGFIATVNLNGHEFNSIQPVVQKKQAEQSAAFAALQILNQYPGYCGRNQQTRLPSAAAVGVRNPYSPGNNYSYQEPSMVTSAGYKNKLQEYFMKRRKDLPKYITVQKDLSGIFVFESTVTVDGKSWKSGDQKTKKGAEKEAARIAIASLGIT